MSQTNVIVVGANGWARRAAELERTGREPVHGYFKQWWNGVTFFHRDGRSYTMSQVHPGRTLGVLDRVLAQTVYNPDVEFAYEYTRGPAYPLEQLRQAVRGAIEADDDILTQFHEGEELLAHLQRAGSFDDVVAVLELAETDDATDRR